MQPPYSLWFILMKLFLAHSVRFFFPAVLYYYQHQVKQSFIGVENNEYS